MAVIVKNEQKSKSLETHLFEQSQKCDQNRLILSIANKNHCFFVRFDDVVKLYLIIFFISKYFDNIVLYSIFYVTK